MFSSNTNSAILFSNLIFLLECVMNWHFSKERILKITYITVYKKKFISGMKRSLIFSSASNGLRGQGESKRRVAKGEATRRRDVKIFCSNFSWQEPTWAIKHFWRHFWGNMTSKHLWNSFQQKILLCSLLSSKYIFIEK